MAIRNGHWWPLFIVRDDWSITIHIQVCPIIDNDNVLMSSIDDDDINGVMMLVLIVTQPMMTLFSKALTLYQYVMKHC